jgi:ATP-dependent helicase HrpB
MSAIPAHPRLARVLLEAERSGVLEPAAALAAMISEGELDRFDAIECFERSGRAPTGAVWDRARKQFLSSLDRGRAAGRSGSPSDDAAHSKLRFALLTGFPDRVAKRRVQELVLCVGGSAQLPAGSENALGLQSRGEEELFVCVDIQEGQALGQQRSKLTVRSAARIEPEWLFDLVPSALTERDEALWDAGRKRVVGVSRLVYDDLVISESQSSEVAPEAKGRLLAKMALGLDLEAARSLPPSALIAEIAKVKPAAAEELAGAVARVGLLLEKAPDLLKSFLTENSAGGSAGAASGSSSAGGAEAAPTPTQWLEVSVIGFLVAFLAGKNSADDLSEPGWAPEYISYLESLAPGISSVLDREAPSSYSFPNGKKARIQYALGQPPQLAQLPWMESALQNFFGVKQAPTVARGRVPIVLHLLAPNQRALQVTQDLPGFWQRVYPELRTQLSRRYPRHSWPEDPASAAPVKR